MNHQLTVNFPVEPAALMPEPLQTIFLGLTAVAAAGVLVWSLLMAARLKSAVPPLMVIGGFVAIIMEPVVTFLGHAIHPAPGQIMLFETVDRAIPWHIALGYMAGFGIFYLLIYGKFIRGTLSTGYLWKAVTITAVCYFLGEAYPVSNGLWVYYDYQPLRIWNGTAPLTWNWLNACSMLTSTTLMLLALPQLKGMARLLLVPLAASGAYMGHMGAGFPMYNAMNTDWPVWAMELSGVASVLLALVVVWLSSVLLVRQQHQSSAIGPASLPA